MKKLRDILLVAVLAAFMLGPGGILLSKAMGIHLPESLDPATADYLAGDKPAVNFDDTLSLDGFASGQLQNDIDTAVTNNIPAKASVLFANAGMLQGAIQASNAFFKWPAYQSYFDSEYLLVPEYNALVQEPYTDEVSPEGLAEFANAVNEFAATHPGVQVDVLLVDRACTSASNPASQLVNDPFTTRKALDIMRDEAIEPNVHISAVIYEDPDEFFSDFHKSDHHWNVNGVMKGLDALYGGLDDSDAIKECLDDIKAAGTRRVDGPAFSGTCVRNGLYQVEDEPMDFAYDFSGMTIVNSDGEESSASVHDVYALATDLNKHYQYYDLYYKGGEKMRGSGQQNALLVSDSFGSAIQWPLGECFDTLWTSNNLQYYENSEDRLSDLCDMDSCDRVIFVGCVLNYSNFLERNPNAFL